MTDEQFAEGLASLAMEYMSERTGSEATEADALTFMLNEHAHRIAVTLVCFNQSTATSAIEQITAYISSHSQERRAELAAANDDNATRH